MQFLRKKKLFIYNWGNKDFLGKNHSASLAARNFGFQLFASEQRDLS